MSLAVLATCYVLFLIATAFSTIKTTQVVVSVKNNRVFTGIAIILSQLTSMIGSAIVTVALAP